MSPASHPSLFFLHIPKTAGTSIVNLLVNRFHGGETHHLADGGATPPPDLDRFGLVYGHAGFDFLSHFTRQPKTLIVLREPIDRALSAFYYFRGLHPVMPEWVQQSLPVGLDLAFTRFRKLPADVSLANFIQRDPDLARLWLSNAQARQLIGPPFLNEAQLPDDALLQQAMTALEQIDVVGSTRHIAETLQQLEYVLNWPSLGPLPYQNQTAKRRSADELSPEVRSILMEWNQVDVALFRRGEELLAARGNRLPQVEEAGQPPDSRLADCVTGFSFGQPISGTGWYAREGSDQRWFCWMGREATLDFLPPSPRDHQLVCRIPHLLQREVLDDLTIEINGRPLTPAFHAVDNEVELHAGVSASIVQQNPGRLRLRLCAPGATRPSELFPGNLDDRVLGLAVSHIVLRPAS